jgi:hypothetical protein
MSHAAPLIEPRRTIIEPRRTTTKFTYKMRSGGKGMWGRGPALYKHN